MKTACLLFCGAVVRTTDSYSSLRARALYRFRSARVVRMGTGGRNNVQREKIVGYVYGPCTSDPKRAISIGVPRVWNRENQSPPPLPGYSNPASTGRRGRQRYKSILYADILSIFVPILRHRHIGTFDIPIRCIVDSKFKRLDIKIIQIIFLVKSKCSRSEILVTHVTTLKRTINLCSEHYSNNERTVLDV